MDISPKQLSPEYQAEIDLYNALEDACVAALGERMELSEHDEIAFAKAIVADFAARGVRMRIYRPRDRLWEIVKERQWERD